MSVHEQQRAGQQPRHVHTLRDSTAHVHMANVDVVVHEQLHGHYSVCMQQLVSKSTANPTHASLP
jgi:hypothetical protein